MPVSVKAVRSRGTLVTGGQPFGWCELLSRVWDGRRSCGITPARWLTNPCMRRGLQRVERGSSVIDSDRVAVEPSPVFGAWFERATIVIGAAIVPR